MNIERMFLKLAVATIVPITNSIQLLPQLVKTYETKSVKDLSLYSVLLILVNNVLWFLHGYFIYDFSLIISGLISIIVNIILFIFYIYYSKINSKN
jgi:MtN3 and saliva related transmembrane protein